MVTPVDRTELLNIINKLHSSKSSGYDNIGPRLIKEVSLSSVIFNLLVYLYNLSFQTGCVPDKLKVAKVISVFKKGDRFQPANYRPISLLSIFDKLIEKLI